MQKIDGGFIRYINSGEAFKLLEDCGSMFKIEAEDGTIGYADSRLFQKHPLISLSDVPESTIPETPYHFKGIIYTGDSRIQQMKGYVDIENAVCRGSTGYEFFIENLDTIKSMYRDDYVILVEFGINDTLNLELYIEAVNGLAAEGYNVAYLNLMPVDEELSAKWEYGSKNRVLNAFNARLYKNLDDRVILLDINSYLWHVGFDMYDGLHFTENTYRIIYRFIEKCLKNK